MLFTRTRHKSDFECSITMTFPIDVNTLLLFSLLDENDDDDDDNTTTRHPVGKNTPLTRYGRHSFADCAGRRSELELCRSLARSRFWTNHAPQNGRDTRFPKSRDITVQQPQDVQRRATCRLARYNSANGPHACDF